MQTKQQLVDEFNKNTQLIQQLANRNQQIIGYIQALEDQEDLKKEPGEKTEEVKVEEVKK